MSSHKHACNALCRDHRHADVYWATGPRRLERIAARVTKPGVRVLDVSETFEAPAVGPDGRSFPHRYLVVVETNW